MRCAAVALSLAREGMRLAREGFIEVSGRCQGEQQGRCGCDVVAGAEWGRWLVCVTMSLYELLCVLIGYDGFQ